jgi:hypothetical protein
VPPGLGQISVAKGWHGNKQDKGQKNRFAVKNLQIQQP